MADQANKLPVSDGQIHVFQRVLFKYGILSIDMAQVFYFDCHLSLFSF